MCSLIQEASPINNIETISNFRRQRESYSCLLDTEIFQILANIYIHYEPHDKYLVLKGRIEYSKFFLDSLIKLAHRFFQNPSNEDLDCCQINITPLDNLADDDIHSNLEPVTVKTRTTAFSPLHSEETSAISTEEIMDYENKYIAEHISLASFYINRDWKIWRLPHDYEHEKLCEGNYSVIYKILDISEGKWLALRLLPESISKKFGPNANTLVSHRFAVIRDLYQESQKSGFIPLQEPPLTTIDLQITPSKIVRGLVEDYFPHGDLHQLMVSKRYGKISLIERLTFCKDLADHFHQLVKLGIYHPDIKPENFLLKKIAKGRYRIYIGDYVDCLRFNKILMAFKTALEYSATTQFHVEYFKALKYIHTKSYMHTKDWSMIKNMFKELQNIFSHPGKGGKNTKEFELCMQTLEEVAIKHQIFALGNTFYQILCAKSPYATKGPAAELYRGENESQIYPTSKPHLARAIFILSPKSKPHIEKITNFVLSMLANQYSDRPNFATVCQEFESYITGITALQSPPVESDPQSKGQNVG